MNAASGDLLPRQSLPDGGHIPQIWKTLTHCLPSRNQDADFWWQLTGKHLALLIDAAAYPIEKQYEILLRHYHYVTPYLGPSPSLYGYPSKWKSRLQHDGTPLTLSWKWNTANGKPDVYIGLEPIRPNADTKIDPWNQQFCCKFLLRISETLSSVDLTQTLDLLTSSLDHNNIPDSQAATKSARFGFSTAFSLEYPRDKPGLNTYFQPRELNQSDLLTIPQWELFFRQLHLQPGPVCRAAVHDFLATSTEGKLMNAFCLSVDNIDPAKAHLRWYLKSPHTSFTAIREVMSLGGRIPSTSLREKQFRDLFSLLKTIANRPADFSEDEEFSLGKIHIDSAVFGHAEISGIIEGCAYSFDITPGKVLPDIKVYFPVRSYARNDLAAAQNLVRWMDSHGRGQYGMAYLNAIAGIASYRRLDEDLGLQSFLGCELKEDELEITSQISPEAFRSTRPGCRRSTRRRGD